MVSEGDSVPKFAVNDANGNKVKSSDFKGKKHAIYFYPKDFTPGCTTEADEFSKDYKTRMLRRLTPRSWDDVVNELKHIYQVVF